MAFDGIVTTSMVTELNNKLGNAKIDKIYQPAPEEIVLNIHSGREKLYLYMSANTSHAGLYLIDDKGENPQNPPAFCMLLRKHLQSARIREIRQVDSERIVEIYTDAVNELGFDVKYKLIIEIMGKHSNILLIDLNTNKILDCIKRVSIDVNRYRQTLPGLLYVAPPSQDKISYFGLSLDDFQNVVGDISTKPDKALMNAIQGISPLAASEICFRASQKTNISIPSSDNVISEQETKTFFRALYDELMTIVTSVSSDSDGTAYVYRDETGTPQEFHSIQLTMYDSALTAERFDSVSRACSAYFEGRTSSNRIRQKSSDIRKSVSSILDRLLLKKQRLSEDLLSAENSDRYRLYGELLTASLHDVRDGRNSAEVLNYYDGTMMSIQLDPRFTAAQNAQRYFKKYAKAKTAVIEKNIQIKETDEDIQYLDSLLTFIDNAKTVEDLDDIRSELVENGLIKRKNPKEKSRKQKVNPYEYHTSSGKKILVGRNNKENDMLTFNVASSTDIWLHTKNIPGSHVILFTGGVEPSESDIFEAAGLAALHSKAKLSGNVPVDYVRVKYVKKPNGAKPGYVIFTNNNTVYVDPSEPEDGLK